MSDAGDWRRQGRRLACINLNTLFCVNELRMTRSGKGVYARMRVRL